MSHDIQDRLRAAYAHRAEQVDAVDDVRGLVARQRQHPRPLRSWWRHRAGPLVVAGCLIAGTTAWVGLEYWASVPVESPFNPGGELRCSGIRTMSPAEAEAELRERGYEVEWQYHPTSGSDIIRSRPPVTDDTVVVEVVVFDADTPALILVEGFDPSDPLHRRLRSGDDCPTSERQ